MKIIVKQLQGAECVLEVEATTTIIELKQNITKRLGIPIEQQKLLLLGRALTDEQTLQSYSTIKDGTRLNLVVKKPDGLYEVSIKEFKKAGMTEGEATSAAKRLLKIIEDKFNKMSWDDIDRLCYDCLLDEQGQTRTIPLENNTESEDNFFTL